MPGLLSKDSIDLVIYHSEPCFDGFGSAFIVYLYSKHNNCNKGVVYKPGIYGKNPPDVKGKNVLICDFSYKYNVLADLMDECNDFMILDHHKSSEENLTGVPDQFKIFDMNKSGVGITWQFFYGDRELPLFFQYIQDLDLFTKKMPFCEEFSLALSMEEYNFNVWEKFLIDMEFLPNLIEKGKKYIEYQRYMVKNIASGARYNIVNINKSFKIVAYCNTSTFVSEVGNQILKMYPLADFACIYHYDNSRNQTKFSLRSSDDKEDVAKIAEMFGGGGHRNASGFTINDASFNLPLEMIDRECLLLRLINKSEGEDIRQCDVFAFEFLDQLEDEEMRNFLYSKFPKCKFLFFDLHTEDNLIKRRIYPIKGFPLYVEIHCVNEDLEEKTFKITHILT